MDLIPKPDQVVSAASNMGSMLLYGGLADLRPMPRTLIDEGTLREVYHYRPGRGGEAGDPVLLVTPLAAPALCFDLRRNCSLVQHFVTGGRPTYLVEYGQVSFKDRNLGMEHWIDEVIPTAIRRVSEHAGNRPVHVIGWSLGGIFSMLSAADQPELPIASLSVIGSPVDVSLVPLVAPIRPLLNLEVPKPLQMITKAYQAAGGAPQPLVRWAFQLSSFQKLVTKPIAVARNLDDGEFLAQIEAVGRFTDNMIAYPGRSFGQLYHRFVRGNALAEGAFPLGQRTIELASITVPTLVFAGATDGIAPMGAVRAVLPLLKNASEVRFEVVPGGHLGMLTGRAARTATWPVLDEWIEEHSSTSEPAHDIRARTRETDPHDEPGSASREESEPVSKKKSSKSKAAKSKPAKSQSAKSQSPKSQSPKSQSPKSQSPKSQSPKSQSPKSQSPKSQSPKSQSPKSKSEQVKPKQGKTEKASPKRAKPKQVKAEHSKSTKPSRVEPTTVTAPGDSPVSDRAAIGSNPSRRYGSRGSRNLAP